MQDHYIKPWHMSAEEHLTRQSHWKGFTISFGNFSSLWQTSQCVRLTWTLDSVFVFELKIKWIVFPQKIYNWPTLITGHHHHHDECAKQWKQCLKPSHHHHHDFFVHHHHRHQCAKQSQECPHILSVILNFLGNTDPGYRYRIYNVYIYTTAMTGYRYRILQYCYWYRTLQLCEYCRNPR